jgi:hypothetical protein
MAVLSGGIMTNATEIMDLQLYAQLKGKVHKIDDPACIYCDGSEDWWENGEPHREGGPAINDIGIQQVWIYRGEYYRAPFRGEPMPVIVKKHEISFDGMNYIPITEDEYEKYRYHPPGKYTKSAVI